MRGTPKRGNTSGLRATREKNEINRALSRPAGVYLLSIHQPTPRLLQFAIIRQLVA